MVERGWCQEFERSARYRGRGSRNPLDEGPSASARRRADQVAAGFLSNITNPKVLVGYLAVLPQFLGADAGLPVLLAYALSHNALSLAYLTLLVCRHVPGAAAAVQTARPPAARRHDGGRVARLWNSPATER